jgi:dTDP-4-dehydrorhamnose reductase
MGVIAFILALNLSTMDVFAGKSKYIEEEVSSCGSIYGTVKYKGPQKDVRIDLMKEKKRRNLLKVSRG